MFMLDDASVRHFARGVIHDGDALVIFLVKNLTFESKASVFQSTQFEVIKASIGPQ